MEEAKGSGQTESTLDGQESLPLNPRMVGLKNRCGYEKETDIEFLKRYNTLFTNPELSTLFIQLKHLPPEGVEPKDIAEYVIKLHWPIGAGETR